jgi:alpha-1,4-digalacturonate transport system substrate-binding protein
MTTSNALRAQFPQWRRLAIGITAALALAACSSGSSGSTSTAGGSSAAPVAKKISFWFSASTAQAAGYETLVKDFQAKEGITVDLVNVPYDSFQTKLRQSAQANSLPDVGSVPSLDPIWQGQLQDLASIATSTTNKINKSVLTATKDGKYLSIPSDVTAAGLYINKSLFDKAGVAYPTDPAKTWTWDEFLKAADTVRTKAGAKYDLVYDRSAARIRPFFYSQGGKGFQLGSDGKYATDPTTVQLLTKFASMNNDTVMPKSVWTSSADPNALFKSGQVVAYVSGVWQVADFAAGITNFEWASAPMPAQPIHATDLNLGGNVVAFNNGDRASAAKKFVEFLFTPENYTKVAETNGYLPVESGLTLNYPFDKQAAKDAFALYVKEIELADPISGSGQAAQMKLTLEGKEVQNDPTRDEIVKLINGQQDAQKTVDNILAGLNAQLG